MKPYEPWEFCRSIDCAWIQLPDNEARKNSFCIDCEAYKFHQYLRDHNQILEAGSELAKAVAEAERLRVDNKAMLEFLEYIKYYFDNPTKYDGAWPEFFSASIKQFLIKAGLEG